MSQSSFQANFSFALLISKASSEKDFSIILNKLKTNKLSYVVTEKSSLFKVKILIFFTSK